MAPLVLVVLGAAALVAAGVVLRSFGAGLRVGRLIAATPSISIAQARSLADRGLARYVRVNGRIDADDEFENEHHRPLVFRRTRLELQRRGRWEPFEDSREAVQFGVREGLDAIRIDSDALDGGLVVIPRIAAGVVADLGDRAPAGAEPQTPVRVRIDQLSSVEHAAVLGVPAVDAAGEPVLTAGLGRPLVLTTLEDEEAMRVIAGGRIVRPRVAAGLLVAGLGLVLAGLAWALVEAFP